MKSIAKLASFLLQYGGWVTVSILLSTISILSGTGLLGTSGYIIAQAALKPPFYTLQLAIVGVRFFGIGRGVFRYLERLVSHLINLKFLAAVRLWFYKVLEERIPFRSGDYLKGDLFARITSDIETLEDLFIRLISPPVTALLVMMITAVFAGLMHPAFVPTILAGMILGGSAMLIILSLATKNSGNRAIQLRAALSSQVKDVIDGNMDIHVYGIHRSILGEFEKLNEKYYLLERKYSVQKALTTLISLLVPGITVCGIIWIGMDLVYREQISGVILTVMILVILSSFEAINPLAVTGEVYSRVRESAGRLLEIQSLNKSDLEPEQPLPFKTSSLVDVERLCFRYPGNRGYLLNDINLNLRPGKITALVGPTGSGKSTISHLMLGLWDYDCGCIRLDGVDIRSYLSEDVRRNFSVVNNSSYIFSKSILENISIANLEAGKEKIKDALKAVGLTDWIEGLPDKYDTQLGQNGILVSGGQRQKLLIARMLVKNAPVMIFDEPGANLDSLAENQLWLDLQPILREHAVLWITHRLVNMEDMDEILFIKGGSIVERGTHEQLLGKQGDYYNMWKIQNRILMDPGDPNQPN